ncbi:MAG: T9SS type A sorting domain-containing protein [Sediminibacterium sp.]
MDLLPNGNLIVVGAKSLSASDTEFAAWVMKPDGTLNSSFAVGGVYEMNLDSGEEYINQVLIHNDLIYLVGRKFTPGFSYTSIAVQCLDLQGNLVTSFGTNGTATFQTSSTDEFNVTGATIVAEGAIAICGDKYNASTFTSVPMIMLMTLNGGPVAAFGNNGLWLDVTGGTYYDIEYSNSKLIAVGTNNTSSFARRHNLDGTADVTFGTNGTFANAVGGYSAFYDCTLGADNKWYACGTTSSGFMVRDFVSSRFSFDGVLDATWGGTGNVVTSLGDSFDDAYGIGLQTDGKVVCAGLTSQPDGNDMGVVRYQGDNGIIYVSGCMSTTACNFDPAANVDNGSCYFVGDPCDDGLLSTDNDAYNANCICEGVSGVEENNLFGLNVFPNPSNNEITLTSDVVGKGTITVVDMTGRMVLQNKLVIAPSQRISIQDLPNGIYSLIVTVDQQQSVVSLVKI